jgi:serine/threonine protein kinase
MSQLPDQIGPYTITREIGRGGMGVVYLAHDTKLDRDVAIKALPVELADDPDRLARFEREAKTLAALNHPHIASIYGLEEVEEKRFLILEYVSGETLDERLERGPIPVVEALTLALQIAEAVEAAHAQGIIHRDLKPANIKFTGSGGEGDDDDSLKVLDFGLAKALGDEAASGSSAETIAHSPTIMGSPSIPGVVLGTAGYLSPEQARGRPVDTRTDIFSFGCVLYEMLTGDTAFGGETVADAIGATLHKNIDFKRLPSDTPRYVRHMLQRCLERDRKKRLRDIGDIRIELENAINTFGQDDADTTSQSQSRGNPNAAMVAVVALVMIVLGVLLGRQLGITPNTGVAHLTIPPPPGYQIRHSGDLAGPAAVSPDGSSVVFSASAAGEPSRLWVRQLDEPDARMIPRTDGAMFPFWSPDSRSIGFFTRDKLRRVDLNTDTIITVCDASQARGGAWTHDGRMIISPTFSGPLMIVSDSGGEPTVLTTYDSEQHTTHRWPQVLPDGKRFLYFAGHRDPTRREEQGIYLATLDGTEPRRLIRCNFGGQYVDGWLLFVRDDVLLASRVDLDSATLTGEIRVLTRDIAIDQTTWHGQFSASAEGTLVFNRRAAGTEIDPYISSGLASGGSEADMLTNFDRTGRATQHFADGLPIASIALSPDGLQLSLEIQTQDGTSDLWLYPTSYSPNPGDPEEKERIGDVVMTPNPNHFTFLQGTESTVVWSPDSDEIIFVRIDGPEGTDGIYRKRVEGGPEELLHADPELTVYPLDWTRDGKYIIFKRGSWEDADIDDIWALPLDGGDPFPLIQTPAADREAQVSPDGRWLAYTSKQSGRAEVYVIPFAPDSPESARLRQRQVSLNGGRDPQWNSDGSELYYISDTGMLLTVPVNSTEQSFELERPITLFQTPWETGIYYAVYPRRDTGNDTFVFMDNRQSSYTPISVILNWQQLLAEDDAP